MTVNELGSRLRVLKGRVRERWGQLMDDELAKMENHRNALMGVVQSWSPDSDQSAQQQKMESQPGLS